MTKPLIQNSGMIGLSYDFPGHRARNEPPHATSTWRAVAVAGS